MIQDILPSFMDIGYKNVSPEDDSVVMIFKEGELLISYDGKKISFPRYKDVICKAEYLFAVDDESFFMGYDVENVPDSFEYMSMREIRKLSTLSVKELFEAFTAYHLYSWYTTSRFCGACGKNTEFDDTERAMICPACGNKIYPRINPAVIIGICNGSKILITRYRTGYAGNALVAGFAEIGETLEDTVRREVMEEVGLKVKNIRYYKSQPWGIASDLLVGFFCDVDGDDKITMDEGELKYASWVEKEAIELQSNDISLTNDMMKVFKFQND